MTTFEHVIASPKGAAILLSGALLLDCFVTACHAYGSQLRFTLAMTSKMGGFSQ